ncbi:MAG: hypothetical protein ACWGN1_02125 [Desulfobulbales bacterium]
MRARLNGMAAGQEFCFLCTEIMAAEMDRIIALAGGAIFNRDSRSYGVVICVRKKSNDGESARRHNYKQ